MSSSACDSESSYNSDGPELKDYSDYEGEIEPLSEMKTEIKVRQIQVLIGAMRKVLCALMILLLMQNGLPSMSGRCRESETKKKD